jgi:hypothetical protein
MTCAYAAQLSSLMVSGVGRLPGFWCSSRPSVALPEDPCGGSIWLSVNLPLTRASSRQSEGHQEEPFRTGPADGQSRARTRPFPCPPRPGALLVGAVGARVAVAPSGSDAVGALAAVERWIILGRGGQALERYQRRFVALFWPYRQRGRAAGSAQRSSWMRTRLPAGSRKAQSRTPYGCSVGSWTTSASLACTFSKVPSRSEVANRIQP